MFEDAGFKEVAICSCLDVLTHRPLGDLNEFLDQIIFQQGFVIEGWDISHEIALRWMSLDLTDKSTLVQVVAWLGAVRQQTITWANVDQDLSPYGVTRPQWVNTHSSHAEACQMDHLNAAG